MAGNTKSPIVSPIKPVTGGKDITVAKPTKTKVRKF